MKHLHIFLLLAITSMPHAYAMRRTINLAQHLLKIRSLSTNTLSDINSIMNACYKQLVENPEQLDTRTLLREQDDSIKQLLLQAAAQDSTLPVHAWITLLETGANINAPNPDGRTPLHLLAQNSNNYFDESVLAAVLAYIAHHNPDFNAKDNSGKTPAEYAPERVRELFEPHEPIDYAKLREIYR